MATPVSNIIVLSGNNFIDGLVQGSIWQFSGDKILTYSLHNQGGSWSGKEKKAIAQVAEAWSAVADIEIIKINSSKFPEDSAADLAISATGNFLQQLFGAVGLGIFPDPDFADDFLNEFSIATGVTFDRSVYPKPEGDMFIDDKVSNSLKPGGFDFETLVHEFGHALGLKHPEDDGENGRPTFADLGIGAFDSNQYTVMSNNPVTDPFVTTKTGFVATPMPLDILAIQHLYGANNNYKTGNDTYKLADDGVIKTIWDTDGNDTIDASKIKTALNIVLEGGEFISYGSKGSMTAIAYDVVIENATGGSADDVLIGNASANILKGGGGDDTLTGFAGDDILDGGSGNNILDGGEDSDTYLFNANDTINDTGTSGTDLLDVSSLKSVVVDNAFVTGLGTSGLEGLLGDAKKGTAIVGASKTTAVNWDFSGLSFTNINLNGSQVADTITGSDTDDTILGDKGDDILNGGLGNDFLDGGDGDDTINGGDGDDTLFGGSGNNILDGGEDSDTYLFNVNDTINDTGASGTDLLDVSSLKSVVVDNAFVTGLGASGLEGLLGDAKKGTAIVGASKTTAVNWDFSGLSFTNINLNGSQVADTITGSDTDDTILGDKGDDILNGGLGNDFLDGGDGDDTINGGDGDDTLFGGSGNNILDGGEDSDTYLFNVNDTINDTGASGTDLLDVSSLKKVVVDNAFVTGLGTSGLEGLLGDAKKGTAIVGASKTTAVNWDFSGLSFTNINLNGSQVADTITGSDTDDTILGDKGDDILNGGLGNDFLDGGDGDDTINGGDGDDTLFGGSGNNILDGGEDSDTYLFNVNDTINDTGASGTDLLDVSSLKKVVVDNAFVTGLGTSGLEGLLGDAKKGTQVVGQGKTTAVNWDFTGLSFTNINLKGSQVNDTITGSNSDDTILGDKGDDVLDGGLGDDVLDAGDGDDTILYDGNDITEVSGGKGLDTLELQLSNETFNLSSINSTVFTDFESVDISGTGDNTLNVTPTDIINFSSSSNVLRVKGDVGDSVNAGGGWTLLGNVTDGAINYTQYKQGDAILEVQDGIDQSSITIGVIELGSLGGSVGFQIDGVDKGDESGRSVSNLGDINGDGYDDIIVGAAYADPNGKDSGESYVIFGKGTAFDSHFDPATLDGTNGFIINGRNPNDISGMRVTGIGDVNGDGFIDIGIAAPNANLFRGQSYIIYGKSEGFDSTFDLTSIDGNNGSIISGADFQDYSGFGLSGAGDVNGDGIDDIIVGAFAAESPLALADSGEAYLILGRSSGFGLLYNVSDTSGSDNNNADKFSNGDQNAGIGFSTSEAGDINGDGFNDIILSAFLEDPASFPANGTGESYVIFGKESFNTSNIFLNTLSVNNGFSLEGINALDFSGFSVSGGGDINGDGFSDLIIGGPGANPDGSIADGTGEIYVVFGKSSSFGTEIELSSLDGNNGFRIAGIDPGDGAGLSVHNAGDVNGDGYDDVIIGAPTADPDGNDDAGEVYLLFGKASGFSSLIQLSDLDGNDGLVLTGASKGDYAGYSVSAAGDINGDGFDDVVIGAIFGDAGGKDSGESYVLFGQDFRGDVDFIGTSGDDNLTGTSADEVLNGGLGDDILDGGAGNDILLGGGGDDILVYDAADQKIIDGGKGEDTLRINTTNTTFNFPETINSEHYKTFTDIEIIELTNTGNTLVFNKADVQFLSSTSNTVKITGASDNTVILPDNWTFTGVTTENTVDYNTYVKDDVSVLVETDIATKNPTSTISLLQFHSANSPDGSVGFKIEGINDNDDLANSISGAGDVNGDGFEDFILGAQSADWTADSTGQSYVIFGKADGFDPEFDLAGLFSANGGNGSNGFVIEGRASSDSLGRSVSSAGDVNGDGYDDLIIGASFSDVSGNNSGESYIIYGKTSGFAAEIDVSSLLVSNGGNGTIGTLIEGADSFDWSGFSVGGGGDINGDGFEDVIIGAPLATPNGTDSGQSFVLFGKSGGFSAESELSSLLAANGGDGSEGFTLDGSGNRTGFAVTNTGDINNDGFDDVLVGAQDESYVFFGKANGFSAEFDLHTLESASGGDGSAGFRINGGSIDSSIGLTGESVNFLNDINGDGIADIVIGSPTQNRAYIIYGKDSAFSSEFTLSALAAGDGSEGFVVHGIDSGDELGFSASNAGDVNGDGIEDLILGAPHASNSDGEVYILYGNANGFDANVQLSDLLPENGADGSEGLVIFGVVQEEGDAVGEAGDINGDGFDDILIGSEYGVSGSSAGNAHIIYGRDFTGEIDVIGTTGNDNLTGTGSDEVLIGGLGDDTLDGAGGNDVLKGAAGDDTIIFDSNDVLKIDGGSGLDTLMFSGSGESLDLTSISNLRYESIESIDLTGSGNNILTLDIQDVLDLSDQSNLFLTDGTKQILILGNSGDVVNSTGQSWVAGSDITVDGNLVTPYTHVDIAAQLLIETDITQNIS